MENLTTKEILPLLGKIYYFDKNLYSQIKDKLLLWQRLQSMLEEVKDEKIKYHLLTKKGEVLSDILRYTTRTEYPDYPVLEDESDEEAND